MEMEKDQGLSGRYGADAPPLCRPSGEAAEEASSAKPAAANAEEYATFVFWHATAEAAGALTRELLERFPFGPAGGDTRLTAMAVGDAMSVSDAMRMALETRALSDDERRELALEMAECVNWDDCVAKAAEWELALDDCEFVDTRDTGGGK